MADPIPTFSYLIGKLKDKHPNLAYIHSIEARVIANYDVDAEKISDNETNDTFRKIWGERPFITNGGFKTSDNKVDTVKEKGGLVAMGRYFISNVGIHIHVVIDFY